LQFAWSSINSNQLCSLERFSNETAGSGITLLAKPY
jgi:hypothetical protein